MEIVSGLGEKPHVTSQQFRQVLEGTIGQKSYIITSGENLEPELAANNLLKIRSGMMSHHGNVSSVKIGTYDEVELTNGSQGMKRIDLVVNRYTRNAETNIEKNEWVVIMGTPVASNPVAPAYTVGNLQKGDLVDDCPVFELHYDGINVTEVKKMLSVLPNVAELNSKLKNAGLAICLAAHASALYIPTTNTININDYRCFVLQCCDSTGNRVLATDLIFPDQIAYGPAYEHTAVYAPEASNYIAHCYFGTDKKIYTKARSQYSSVRLYGIPKN